MARVKQTARRGYSTAATRSLAAKPGTIVKTGKIVESAMRPDTWEVSGVERHDMGLEAKLGADERWDVSIGIDEEEGDEENGWEIGREEEEMEDEGGEETRKGKQEKELRSDEYPEKQGPQAEHAARTSSSPLGRQQEESRKESVSSAVILDPAHELRRAKKNDEDSIATVLNKFYRTPAYLAATKQERTHLQEQASRAETQRRIARDLHTSAKVPQMATKLEDLLQMKGPPTQEETARAMLFKSLGPNPKCKKALSRALYSLRRTPAWTQASTDERIRMNETAAARAVQKWPATQKGQSADKESSSSSSSSKGTASLETARTASMATRTGSQTKPPTLRPPKTPKSTTGSLPPPQRTATATATSIIPAPSTPRAPSPPSPRPRKPPKAVTGVLRDWSTPAETWTSPAGYAVEATSAESEEVESWW